MSESTNDPSGASPPSSQLPSWAVRPTDEEPPPVGDDEAPTEVHEIVSAPAQESAGGEAASGEAQGEDPTRAPEAARSAESQSTGSQPSEAQSTESQPSEAQIPTADQAAEVPAAVGQAASSEPQPPEPASASGPASAPAEPAASGEPATVTEPAPVTEPASAAAEPAPVSESAPDPAPAAEAPVTEPAAPAYTPGHFDASPTADEPAFADDATAPGALGGIADRLGAAVAAAAQLARERPEIVIGAAFAGGFLLAQILKRVARSR